MRRFSCALGLGLVLVVLGLWGAHSAAGAPARTPLLTPTPSLTPSFTPTVEPELAILQYVVDHNQSMMCDGPGGTPGHRLITNCYPYGNFTHPTSASVDGFADPPAAQAQWLVRRANAQASFPIFMDLDYFGYPGYQGGNTNYPYAPTENCLWGARWVLCANSLDDTNFRGSPIVAGAVFQAAQVLGYLPPNPTPTETGTPTQTPTPTRTPLYSPTPAQCEVFTMGATASCAAPDTYHYHFSFWTYGCAVSGYATIHFEVAANPNGPWTPYDQTSMQHTWPAGGSTIEGDFYEPGIPPAYTYFQVWISGVPGPPGQGTGAQPLCGAGSPTVTGTPQTPTRTPTCVCVTFTPTRTATPTISPVALTATYTPGGAPTHTRTPAASQSPSVAPTQTDTPVPSQSPTPCPIQYGDVPASNPFYPYVRCLACRGILSGYADGTFRPFAPVTRGQAAKILANAAGYSEPIAPTQQTFADVPPTQPFWLPVERAALHGLFGGYDCGGAGEPCDAQHRPYFRLYANLTRGQLAKIDATAAGYTDVIPDGQQTFADVPQSHPFWHVVERVALHGVINGYACGGPGEPCDAQQRPYYRPYVPVTRGQAAKIVANTFHPACVTPRR